MTQHSSNPVHTDMTPPTQFLMLSLFLLLLAFFIAMTAGAKFDQDKTMPVIDSLEKVFPVKELRGRGLPSTVDQPMEARGAGQSRAGLEGFFTSDAFPFQPRLTRENGAFIVTMRREEVEELLSLTPAVVMTDWHKQGFFAQLASFLRPLGGEKRNQLYIIVSARQDPAQLAARIHENGQDTAVRQMSETRLSDMVARAENYAAAFVKNGIRGRDITVGIAQGRGDSVRLMFVPVTPAGAAPVVKDRPAPVNDLGSGNLEKGILR